MGNMIMETTPLSVNEIATIVPETSINPDQSLPIETAPSSMNETSNVQQTSHNQEHETPSATAGNASMNVTDIDVPEINNNQEHSLTMETTSSSIPEPLPRQPTIKHNKKTILAWLTACKEIDEGTQVRYHDGEKPITGRIFNGAILCSCCDEEISVWKFEKHAQSEDIQPYKRILVATRKSVLQNILISKWLKEDEQKRRDMFMYAPIHDIVCLVCGKGEDEGEFINCTNCPSTYHRSCAFIQGFSQENDDHWLCSYCSCKYCKGGHEEEYPLDILCRQCNKKCHWMCLNKSEKDLLRTHCSIDEKLKGSIGIQNNINGNESYSWRVLQQMDTKSEDHYVISNSKVAATCMLMEEAFGMITDKHTGVNVVQSVLYNRRSNLRRLDFRRCYTFIIEEDDAIIAAATVRFHGKGLAEMPFIATDEAYRGKRICHLLMEIIESFLQSLEVERLTIPSNPQTVEMWKQKYSFSVVNDKKLKKDMVSYNLLMFPGAIRLSKRLFLDLNEPFGNVEPNTVN
ncbi:GNAT family acetyltransferase [Medicago truncatula]|uniref:GNAT family acetyltransferase n=1 Tax=Medicago truncatula TaxID=3880 RepID=A0A072UPL4_MEDTR|nr:GNAT family acetyltransferase [Medicago truncatula]